jgi:hypothetical protein
MDRGRKIERACKLRRDSEHVASRRRSVFSDGEVQRVGRDVILGEKGRHAADSRRQRRRQRRMREVRGDEALEFCDELMRALRRHVEFEELDGDEPLQRRIVGSKNRTQCPRANLMKCAKRSEGVGGCVASSVSVQ